MTIRAIDDKQFVVLDEDKEICKFNLGDEIRTTYETDSPKHDLVVQGEATEVVFRTFGIFLGIVFSCCNGVLVKVDSIKTIQVVKTAVV